MRPWPALGRSDIGKNVTDTDNTLVQPVNWNRLQIIQKIRDNHTGKNEIKELQKSAIMGTAHLLRRGLI
jgi:hypothetical protein